jgi:hypothetical protein
MKKEELPQASEILGKAFASQPSSFVIYKGISDLERLSKMINYVGV